jgi:exosortase K
MRSGISVACDLNPCPLLLKEKGDVAGDRPLRRGEIASAKASLSFRRGTEGEVAGHGGFDQPWLSWITALLAAYGLKLAYSRASAADLGWILLPTARAVGWLRGETLTFDPGAGWVGPWGSYVIAPACAGVNFLILVLTVSVLGFSHRLRSPVARLGWWAGSFAGAYVLTLAVNTLRILAAVELYRRGPIAGLDPEQVHRLLGTVLYLGALWGLYATLDRIFSRRGSGLAVGLLVVGAYLGMTVVAPLLNGHPGSRYAEHAMMVSLVAGLSLAGRFAVIRWRS